MKAQLKKMIVLFITLTIALNYTSCKSVKNANNKQKGSVIGAASGAVLGGILGNNLGKGGKGTEGAVLGGVIGGAAGVLIGNKMDKQSQKIEEEIPGAKVERINDEIVVTFDENSGVYFPTGQMTLNDSSKQTLDKLANVLLEYTDTNIVVEGHTDSVGTASSNLNLSKSRAQSVTTYLNYQKGINIDRITTLWYGETRPIYDNNISTGRAKNRRVNILIKPNQKMIDDANEKAKN